MSEVKSVWCVCVCYPGFASLRGHLFSLGKEILLLWGHCCRDNVLCFELGLALGSHLKKDKD